MKAFLTRIGHKGETLEESRNSKARFQQSKGHAADSDSDGNLYYVPSAMTSSNSTAAADIGLAPVPQSGSTSRNKQRSIHRSNSLGTLRGILAASKVTHAEPKEEPHDADHVSDARQSQPTHLDHGARRTSAHSALSISSRQSSIWRSSRDGGDSHGPAASPYAAGSAAVKGHDTARPSLGQLAKSRMGSWRGTRSDTGPPSATESASVGDGSNSSSKGSWRTRGARSTTGAGSTPSHPPSSYHFDPAPIRTKRKGASPPIPSALSQADEDVHPAVFVVSNPNKPSPRASLTEASPHAHAADRAGSTATSLRGRPKDGGSHPSRLDAQKADSHARTQPTLPGVDSTLSITAALSQISLLEPENSTAIIPPKRKASLGKIAAQGSSLHFAAVPQQSPIVPPTVPPQGPESDATSIVCAPRPTPYQEHFDGALAAESGDGGDCALACVNAGGSQSHDTQSEGLRRGGQIATEESFEISHNWAATPKRSPIGSLLKRKNSESARVVPSVLDRRRGVPQPKPVAAAEHLPASPMTPFELAARLSELAVSHADGLLSDDEYRLLRLRLFEQSTGGNGSGQSPDLLIGNRSPIQSLNFRLADIPQTLDERALDVNVRGGAFAFTRPSVIDIEQQGAVEAAGLMRASASPEQRARLISTTSSSRHSANLGTRSLFRRGSAKSRSSEKGPSVARDPSLLSVQRAPSGDVISMPPPPPSARYPKGRSARNLVMPSSVEMTSTASLEFAASPSQYGSSLHSGSDSVGASSSGAGGRRSLRPSTISRLMSEAASRHSVGEGAVDGAAWAEATDKPGERGQRSRYTSTSSSNRFVELEREVQTARLARSRMGPPSRSGSLSESPSSATGGIVNGGGRRCSKSTRAAAPLAVESTPSGLKEERKLHRERASSLPKSSHPTTTSVATPPTPGTLAALASAGSGFDVSDWRYADKSSGEIEAEIRVVEAEGRRMLESFEGLEASLLRRAGPDGEARLMAADQLASKAELSTPTMTKSRHPSNFGCWTDRASGLITELIASNDQGGAPDSCPMLNELRDIRLRRAQVARRYNERLAFLQSKVRSAKIRQKLAKS